MENFKGKFVKKTGYYTGTVYEWNLDDWARVPGVNFALLDNLKVPKKSISNG